MQLRGDGSLGFPKNDYDLETYDDGGRKTAVEILGFPRDSDWVLQGPYSDKSLMRNALACGWSNRIGRWAPRTRFVEAFINANGGKLAMNDYWGVHVFTEKIKGGPDRVDVVKLLGSDVDEPNVTGGYILKKHRLEPGEVGLSTTRTSLCHVEPEEARIKANQKDWIRSWLVEFEGVLYGTDFRDPVNGYAKYIDPGSFVDHHILTELVKNIDGFRLSTFMFKDRGGRLNMGPVCVDNLALGNVNYLDGWNPLSWYWPLLGDGDYPWWRRLFQALDFQQLWIDRWGELRRDLFATGRLLADVDENAAILAEAQVRNFQRWPVLGTYVWPNYHIANTYEEEIEWMKDWIKERVAWIDSQYTAAPDIEPGGGEIHAGGSVTVTITGPAGATVHYSTDGRDPRQPGGGIDAASKEYSAPFALSENAQVVARARSTLGWSAPAAATFIAVTRPFRRGDSNADGATDISDAAAILGYLFLGLKGVPCEQAGDANDDGALDISDAIYVLSFLFLGGEAIEPPVGACGVDPTGHDLPCQSFPGCE
jgi:hypothetical protein